MKKCPYCAEEVQDEARLCKHCKKPLPGVPACRRCKKKFPPGIHLQCPECRNLTNIGMLLVYAVILIPLFYWKFLFVILGGAIIWVLVKMDRKVLKQNIWIFVSVALTVVVIGIIFQASSKPVQQAPVAHDVKPPTQPTVEKKPAEPKDMSSEAIICSQNQVKEMLRSPSTAKFPWLDYSVSKLGESYVVLGYVDAQNGFGATIRQNWRCAVQFPDSNWLDCQAECTFSGQ